MGLLDLLIILIVVGVVLWLIETKIPMDDSIKVVIRVVVVIVLIVWLLKVFGVADIPIGRVR